MLAYLLTLVNPGLLFNEVRVHDNTGQKLYLFSMDDSLQKLAERQGFEPWEPCGSHAFPPEADQPPAGQAYRFPP